jgi:tetratricopeptide (TPR) repeat protein
MLGTKEASLYYYLAKDAFSGHGTIVDAGSFLGKSGYYLAQGLRANPHYVPGTHRVHCFDNFIVNESITVAFIESHLGQRLAIGDSTRNLFDAQVAPVVDLLEVHAGDFYTATWPEEPIEILIVDIAKSQGLGRKVIENFFPHLIPGESLVIQQDYHHPWLPHLHVVMEFLAEYFELVVPRADDSAVFFYKAAIPNELLERAIRYDFTGSEQLELMNRAAARLCPEDRFIVELAGLVLRSGIDNHPGVATALADLERRFNEQPRDYPQNSYFDDVGFHLKTLDAWRLYGAGDFAGALRLADEIVVRSRTAHSLLLRGMTLSALRRDTEAERDLRFAQQVGPPLGYCHVELAKVLLRKNQLDEAEAQVLMAVRDATLSDATTRDYLETLYLIWSVARDPRRHQTTMTELRARLPGDPEVWLLDGRLHEMCGDSEAAAASWRRATELGLPAYRLSKSADVQKDGRIPADSTAWQRVPRSGSGEPVKSLLSAAERQYLTWLTEERYEGWGAIVELGAWLGSSSTCLAEGLRRRGFTTKIHTFDRFEWENNVSHIAGFDLVPGSDFLPLYIQSIGDYAPWIEAKKTDLMGYVWDGGPIEILFVDSAKTWDLTSSVLRGFGHALVPGRSRVVLQDFRYPWAYCLPLIFDSRPDVWKQIEDLDDSTTVTFVPLRPLFGPCGLHEHYSEDAFPFEAAREVLSGRIAREHGRNRNYTQWALYRKCLIDGPLEEALNMRNSLVAEGVDEEFFPIAEDVEYPLHGTGWEAFQRGDYERAKSCGERCLVRPGPRSIYALTLLGFALCRLGDRQRAAEIATEILERVPGFPSAKMLRGEIAVAEGRHEAAEEETLEVLRATSSNEMIIEWCLNTLLGSWNRDTVRTSRADVLKEFETSLSESPAFRSHMAREQALAAGSADHASAPAE